MSIRLFVPVAIVALGVVAAGCDIKVDKEGGLSFDVGDHRATDEWTRSYTVTPGGRLEIVNYNGNIDAYAAPGPTVELTAMRMLRASSPEEAQASLKTLEMIEEVAADRVHVATPERRGANGEFGRTWVSVNYRVGVPAGLVVSLKTQNGQVNVKDVQGRLSLTTTNGGLTLIGVSGPLEARTVNGGVTADLPALSGDATFGAVNGGVRISVATTLDADLELSAVNGGVSVEEDKLTVSTTQKERQNLRGRLNKGGPKIVAQVVNGGVRVAAMNSGGR